MLPTGAAISNYSPLTPPAGKAALTGNHFNKYFDRFSNTFSFLILLNRFTSSNIKCNWIRFIISRIATQTNATGSAQPPSACPLLVDGRHLPTASPYAMSGHSQLPHLHHHASQTLQSHDAASARYLWDPSAVAASNFHHPSAHG